jgi:hypothetical protein
MKSHVQVSTILAEHLLHAPVPQSSIPHKDVLIRGPAYPHYLCVCSKSDIMTFLDQMMEAVVQGILLLRL